MADRLQDIKNMVEAMDGMKGDFTAQLFGCEMDAKAVIEDFKWLIEKVERYENAVNLATLQLEESESIPFALDALKEVEV